MEVRYHLFGTLYPPPAPEDKRLLFTKIFASLKPGGMFVNADQADGETLYFRQRYLDYWNQFLKKGPLNTKEHKEILTRRDILDRNEKMSVQLQWLHECGFSDVDVVFKNRTFMVTVARKAINRRNLPHCMMQHSEKRVKHG